MTLATLRAGNRASGRPGMTGRPATRARAGRAGTRMGGDVFTTSPLFV